MSIDHRANNDHRNKDFKPKDEATKAQLEGLTAAQQNVRDQLAILRQTRGQRDVGSLKIPPHLQQPMQLVDAGVKERVTRAGGDE